MCNSSRVALLRKTIGCHSFAFCLALSDTGNNDAMHALDNDTVNSVLFDLHMPLQTCLV